MTNATAVRPNDSMRLRGRSFMAFVLAPALPIRDWVAQLDEWSGNSPNFFVGRPIILDVAGLTLTVPEIAELVALLAERGIRVMGLAGAQPDQLAPSLPPLLQGGRSAPAGDIVANACADPSAGSAVAAAQPEPGSLMIENPVRSGQSIVFPAGDVVVLGSVSSGAEIVAGGSIHVYGALRGRAMAGATGNRRARIFCSRNEAELVSIDGYYRTADQIESYLRSRATQCWLEDRVLTIAALD